MQEEKLQVVLHWYPKRVKRTCCNGEAGTDCYFEEGDGGEVEAAEAAFILRLKERLEI